MRRIALIIALALFTSVPALAQTSAVIADPPVDAAHPAAQVAFVLPVKDGAMNAVMLLASGAGPHPTLLLLHGFPGNEQNLDLAQAARRDGWNVLTLHYRGSWASPGTFSLSSAAEDAHAALAFLRTPAVAAKFRVDPARIAVAGHSMGGFMAADAAADDPAVIGLFLIDAWDIGREAHGLATPEGRKAWHEEAVGDLPPLTGTSEAALSAEMIAKAERFSLEARIAAYGSRPLAVYGAARGNGVGNLAYLLAAHKAGNTHLIGALWNTDHPFSDKRIALTQALIEWLDEIAPPVR